MDVSSNSIYVEDLMSDHQHHEGNSAKPPPVNRLWRVSISAAASCMSPQQRRSSLQQQQRIQIGHFSFDVSNLCAAPPRARINDDDPGFMAPPPYQRTTSAPASSWHRVEGNDERPSCRSLYPSASTIDVGDHELDVEAILERAASPRQGAKPRLSAALFGRQQGRPQDADCCSEYGNNKQQVQPPPMSRDYNRRNSKLRNSKLVGGEESFTETTYEESFESLYRVEEAGQRSPPEQSRRCGSSRLHDSQQQRSFGYLNSSNIQLVQQQQEENDFRRESAISSDYPNNQAIFHDSVSTIGFSSVHHYLQQASGHGHQGHSHHRRPYQQKHQGYDQQQHPPYAGEYQQQHPVRYTEEVPTQHRSGRRTGGRHEEEYYVAPVVQRHQQFYDDDCYYSNRGHQRPQQLRQQYYEQEVPARRHTPQQHYGHQQRHHQAQTSGPAPTPPASDRHHSAVKIEVTPGHFLALRGSQETMRAMEAGRLHLMNCLACGISLGCVPDCEMVICPECRTVSPTTIMSDHHTKQLRDDDEDSLDPEDDNDEFASDAFEASSNLRWSSSALGANMNPRAGGVDKLAQGAGHRRMSLPSRIVQRRHGVGLGLKMR